MMMMKADDISFSYVTKETNVVRCLGRQLWVWYP